jgi:hypothetical protein
VVSLQSVKFGFCIAAHVEPLLKHLHSFVSLSLSWPRGVFIKLLSCLVRLVGPYVGDWACVFVFLFFPSWKCWHHLFEVCPVSLRSWRVMLHEANSNLISSAPACMHSRWQIIAWVRFEFVCLFEDVWHWLCLHTYAVLSVVRGWHAVLSPVYVTGRRSDLSFRASLHAECRWYETLLPITKILPLSRSNVLTTTVRL